MIHVLLLILKITGILLLVLLGLILAVLLCILFVPVRYRLKGSRHEELKAFGQVFWLLHAVSLSARYQEKELDIKLKLFGITLWPRKKKEKKRREAAKEDGREILLSAPISPPTPDDALGQEIPQTPKQEEELQTGGFKPVQTFSPPPSPGFVRRIFLRIRGFFAGFWEKVQKIKFSILGIYDKLRNMKNTARSLLCWIQEEQNQKNIRFLADCLKQVFRHILPRKGNIRLVFGFEDPSSTGQVLAWVSPFYPLYGRVLTLEPVFDQPVLEGEGDVRGRIRLFALLRIGFRIRRNREVWNMLISMREKRI